MAVHPSDDELVERARRLVDAHRRGISGFCVACQLRFGHLVRHPCGYANWAALVVGHQMTLSFLGLPVRTPPAHANERPYTQVTVYPVAHSIWRKLDP